MRIIPLPVGDAIDSAEDWLARLHSPECTAEERTNFERWRQNTPGAAAACEKVERIYELSGALSRDPWLAMAARSARLRSQHMHKRHIPRFAWAAVAAASLLLIVVGLWWHDFSAVPIHGRQYATAVGEQRTLYLGDGTAVVLDTDSVVTVHYDAQRREVTLDHGRAQFDVPHDAGRPFLVHAGSGVIRDIGTRFQVRFRAGDATVTLLQGKVSVSLPAAKAFSTLAPGQQVSYAGGMLNPVEPADLAAARGWTRGELVFQNRTLADLVAEMNLYSTQKLQLGDPALARLRISGVFHAGDQTSLLQGLRRGWGLRARNEPPHTIVLEPPASD